MNAGFEGEFFSFSAQFSDVSSFISADSSGKRQGSYDRVPILSSFWSQNQISITNNNNNNYQSQPETMKFPFACTTALLSIVTLASGKQTGLRGTDRGSTPDSTSSQIGHEDSHGVAGHNAIGATTTRELYGSACSGYFCDKKLNEIVITMTHNSLSILGKNGELMGVNQHWGLAKQFQVGIRGFNPDLYYHESVGIFHAHDLKTLTDPKNAHESPYLYDPRAEVDTLISELDKSPNEFIVVQMQDSLPLSKAREFATWFGDRAIKNFDKSKRLGDYISVGQNVLIASDTNSDPAYGIHYTNSLITENNYEWRGNANEAHMPTNFRRGEGTGNAMLMAHFISNVFGIPDPISQAMVNNKNRILYDARRFVKEDYTGGKINVVMVDFVDLNTDEVFAAEDALRANDINSGCWADGTTCALNAGPGGCFNCCSASNTPVAATRVCGSRKCFPKGTWVAVWDTHLCCNGVGPGSVCK